MSNKLAIPRDVRPWPGLRTGNSGLGLGTVGLGLGSLGLAIYWP